MKEGTTSEMKRGEEQNATRENNEIKKEQIRLGVGQGRVGRSEKQRDNEAEEVRHNKNRTDSRVKRKKCDQENCDRKEKEAKRQRGKERSIAKRSIAKSDNQTVKSRTITRRGLE